MDMGDVNDPLLISEQAPLADFCAQLGQTEIIAIDTEFVRERTYFARLCLIQIAVGERIVCVDCSGDLDLEPLFERIFRPHIASVAHSARQDLEVFWHAAGAIPERLIDTQIAAALLGFAPQIGLQEILQATLGISLEKAHTRTDWSKRPLADAALRYAVDDVKYLLPLWQHLRAVLEERGRLEWFEEDCRRALGVALEPDTATIYRRLKGSGALRGADVGAALALLEWRERRARRADRPRRWILADAVLVRLARARPAAVNELRQIDGLSERTIAKSGESIVEAIARAKRDDIRALQAEVTALERPDPAQLKALQRLVADRAAQLGIRPEVLAAKRDLAEMAVGQVPSQLASGWRASQLGFDEQDNSSDSTALTRKAQP